jgi:Histidine kinase-, DNA gyrase B-, and HSP90-like ATPase
MASHEFRTPLTIIDGQAQRLINMKSRLTHEDMVQRARSVRTAVSRMTGVIDNLIDACRLIDGRAELYFHPGEFDLAALLHEICHSHRELTPRAEIVERLADRPLTVFGDQKLLFQVFHNLISNAVKYSPLEPMVQVSAEIIDGHAVVMVADRGLGIPEADREHLFERYYRGRNVEGIVGSGIGLYLVKTVIDLHRGQISVESESGKGSRFIVQIAAGAPTLAAPSDAPAAAKGSADARLAEREMSSSMSLPAPAEPADRVVPRAADDRDVQLFQFPAQAQQRRRPGTAAAGKPPGRINSDMSRRVAAMMRGAGRAAAPMLHPAASRRCSIRLTRA